MREFLPPFLPASPDSAARERHCLIWASMATKVRHADLLRAATSTPGNAFAHIDRVNAIPLMGCSGAFVQARAGTKERRQAR
jgi:hypothetical protein